MTYYEIQNLYLEHIGKDELVAFLQSNYIEEYYGILHDKDCFVDENGTTQIKKPHYHLIVGTTEDSRTAKKTLCNLFKTISEKDKVNFVRNFNKALRYLRHQDDSNKYQYEFSEVLTNSLDIYREVSCVACIKSSMTDIILNQFIEYCYNIDKDLSYIEIMQYFKNIGKSSYFLQYQKNLIQLNREIYYAMHNINPYDDLNKSIDIERNTGICVDENIYF